MENGPPWRGDDSENTSLAEKFANMGLSECAGLILTPEDGRTKHHFSACVQELEDYGKYPHTEFDTWPIDVLAVAAGVKPLALTHHETANRDLWRRGLEDFLVLECGLMCLPFFAKRTAKYNWPVNGATTYDSFGLDSVIWFRRENIKYAKLYADRFSPSRPSVSGALEILVQGIVFGYDWRSTAAIVGGDSDETSAEPTVKRFFQLLKRYNIEYPVDEETLLEAIES